MAIYRLSMSIISRSKGGNGVAAAAYRSGDKLRDCRNRVTHDYRRKTQVDFAELIAPANAPEWARDREQLWNKVEASEHRCDSQVARECLLSLPKELSLEQNRQIVNKFVQQEFITQGMVADIAYHKHGTHNPHAHVLLTTRKIKGNDFGLKRRDWMHKSKLMQHRIAWEECANQALEKAGYKQRIDHRSLEAQGIERIPQIKMGKAATALERQGIKTEKGNKNREIFAANQWIKLLQLRLLELEKIRAKRIREEQDRTEQSQTEQREIQKAKQRRQSREKDQGWNR